MFVDELTVFDAGWIVSRMEAQPVGLAGYST
jgi:hypothetical protein